MNLLVTNGYFGTSERMNLEGFCVLGWGTILLPDQETHDTIVGMCLLTNLDIPWSAYQLISDGPNDVTMTIVEILN